ncbi:contractile injection system protein, VgrG/Pvc8 family [Zooshikella ganghwensis]|uniref:contractile injection system protein, VgrG/Pvc8 family n=1 Tax=Zooshikella ganghwensis TaxID=202772 RepID=UPI000404D9A2|nr:contractile injection system protein, VgrG/Pvc8 family [Zooshikella ganghwensis]
MQPTFSIFLGDKNLTPTINPLLMSLELTDEAGWKSDSLTLTLVDDGSLAIPKKGVKLSCALGYVESGLVHMGNYTVDEVLLSKPPMQMQIKARGANLKGPIRAPRSQSWHQVKLTDLVGSIAQRHNLSPKVAEKFTDLMIQHIDQTEESDLHFLSRIANQYDAIAKPAGEHLLFVERNQGKTASGKQLETIHLSGKDITSYRGSLPERSGYQRVIAKYHNSSTGKTESIIAGKGEPTRTLSLQYPTREAAQAAANAAIKGSERSKASLEITLPGDPRLVAERPVSISGLRTGLDGKWMIKTARHRMSGEGYGVSVKLGK